MDTIEAILGEVWDTLTEDADMQDLFDGTVRLTPVWADPDSPFPYMVYRLDANVQEPWAVAQGTLTIDVWDYEPTAQRLMRIRQRVIDLLDRGRFEVEQAGVVRVNWLRDASITEEVQYIWRRTMDFNVRFTRNAEVGAIVAREE